MLEVASLIIINLIVAAIIGFIIGYIVGKSRTNTSVKNDDNQVVKRKSTNSSINPVFQKNSNLDNKPLVLSAHRPSGKDNLKKIKGIDEKIEEDLNNLGIYHFDQISKWSSKNCDWIEAFLLLPGCAKDNQWVEQARILETGKETIFSQKIENNA